MRHMTEEERSLSSCRSDNLTNRGQNDSRKKRIEGLNTRSLLVSADVIQRKPKSTKGGMATQ
jgi:hypothetical protein